MEENNPKNKRSDVVYSQRVRAGKRTYFFDVKATKSEDYYLTITESKRRYKGEDLYFEKHKIFLYKEDFEKFRLALEKTTNHIKENLLSDTDFSQYDQELEDEATVPNSKYTSAGLEEDDNELSWD